MSSPPVWGNGGVLENDRVEFVLFALSDGFASNQEGDVVREVG
jgi:hypothetical protein